MANGSKIVVDGHAISAGGVFRHLFRAQFIITEGEPERVDNYPGELAFIR